jgi:(4-(4-[2-(gamma-L-glutamylamino)ethyl]phenoxymethyl)furan-2-yl)methanamine synthase
MEWLALDIGGAHLKAADGDGLAIVQPFALWQNHKQLCTELRALLSAAGDVDHLAVTMTGELCDCFSTKKEGVEFILKTVEEAAAKRHTRVYLTSGALVAPQVALRQPLLAAASNWHALGRFAGKFVKRGCGLLIDIGSTTCDIIPLVDGQPVTLGRTDPNRLVNGELIYTGVQRSPVCAVVRGITWRGKKCPVAHEVFATMWDVYLMLGDLPEEPNSQHTADGRPATKWYAHDRLARMICADRELFTDTDALAAARGIARVQLSRIATVAHHVMSRLQTPPEAVVISGQGEFLARRVLERLGVSAPVVSLQSELGPELSRCATAHALAWIAQEGLR